MDFDFIIKLLGGQAKSVVDTLLKSALELLLLYLFSERSPLKTCGCN